MPNAAPAEPTPASVLLQPPPTTHNLAFDTRLPMPPQTAAQASAPAHTRTRITTKLSDSGKKRAFTAKVFTHSGWTPTGTVTFKDGPKFLYAEAPLDRGITTIKVKACKVNGIVTAIYSGDHLHATSSETVELTGNASKAEPSAPKEIGAPCDDNAERTPAELPIQAPPITPTPPSGAARKAATRKLVDPTIDAKLKRASQTIAEEEALKEARRADARAQKMADKEARKQARQTAARNRKHVPSRVASQDDTAAASTSVDAGNAPSAADNLGAEDATQRGISAADDSGSPVDPPEEVALEHEIVTLLQERQKKAAIFGRNKNAAQESKKDVVCLQAELDRVLYEYKQQLAKTGRNGRWTPFLRNHQMSRATADRWAHRHDLRVNPKPVIGPDEALSGPSEKDVTALVKKVLRLTRVLTTPDSMAQFLRSVTAVLQPPTSAA